MRPHNRRRILVIGIALLVMVVSPCYIRAFVVIGDSDAPGFATGDRVLVNLAAFDIRVPYLRHPLVRLADPRPGDMVLIRLMDGQLAVKRVVAGPGTRIAMRDNHVVIDGILLEYEGVPTREKAAIDRGHLGPVVEMERGNGPDVYVSFAHGGSLSSFDEQLIPEAHYFVLGSNRDASMDSRHFGPVRREGVLGKIVRRMGSAG